MASFVLSALLVLAAASAAAAQNVPGYWNGIALSNPALLTNNSYVNRVNANYVIVPPHGCLTFEVTTPGAYRQCLKSSSFTIDSFGVATPQDFKLANISGPYTWFNASQYEVQAPKCASKTPQIVSLFETSSCVLASAADATVGVKNTAILQSAVCDNQAQATTSYQAEWGYSAAEQALCQDVIALAGQTLSEEAGTPVPNGVCEYKRVTYTVTNPCAANVSMHYTNTFQIGADGVQSTVTQQSSSAQGIAAAPGLTVLAPGGAPTISANPALGPAPAPMTVVAPAPAPVEVMAPVPTPTVAAKAPAPTTTTIATPAAAPTVSTTAAVPSPSPTTAPAPAPSSATSTAAFAVSALLASALTAVMLA